MTVCIYWENKAKEYYFSNVMDGKFKLGFYSKETGLDFDIEFFILINNGVKTVGGRNIRVFYENGRENEEKIVENDVKLLVNYQKCSVALMMYDGRADVTDFKKYVVSKDKVDVGIGGDIEYSARGKIRSFFTITYEDDGAYVMPYINRIYHNNERIDGNKKRRIRFGDTLSYSKLKIIYLGNVVAVNNPDYDVRVNLKEFKYGAGGGAKEYIEEEEDKFFTRSPRIIHRLIAEKLDIDPPTAKKENREKPLLLAIGPSATMALAMIVSVVYMVKSGSSGRSIVPSAVMACSMFAGAVIWPIALRKYTKKQNIADEEKRKSKYYEYIDDIDKKLEGYAEYNRKVYDEMYPRLEELYRHARNADARLWNLSPYDDGFLDLRIGMGTRKFTVDINIFKEKFTLEDDPLKKYAQVVKDKYSYIPDVPYSIDLKEMNMLGILGEGKKRRELVKVIIGQIAITHCYTDVKIGAVFDERDAEFGGFIKRLPHVWDRGRKVRLAACDRDGAYAVFKRIKDIYDERSELKDNEKQEGFLPHYVIFITDPTLLENNYGMKEFVYDANGCGITFVFACDDMGQLPMKCRNIIQLSEGSCTVYSKDDNSGKMAEFIPDGCGIDMEKLAETLAAIKVNEVSEEEAVPDSLGFFDLYKAKNIEALAIGDRWRVSDVSKTLAAPLGAMAGGEVFSLNIHEKAHGPHGLIAGTTGSGKSEFIMSYILSMAVNYPPEEVAFVLIDYKGGGMAGAFEKLPHVVGIITNLEGNQIKRSMISLRSEVLRRQEVLKKSGGLKNIDQYQRLYREGRVKEPMPHLIIISDEFAELKSQEPDFMNEIIRISRIGRSLGVHLILATQKPSGVVNEQIWSNTNFRVCLKVQDRTDSKEVLKRDDAAYITQPGRAYVQVGNDEIFTLIQSGYSGGKYLRGESNYFDKSAEIVSCIDLMGRELCKFDASTVSGTDSKETQLGAVVDYIADYAKSIGIESKKIWKPVLPKLIGLEDIDKRDGGFDGEKWLKTDDVLMPAIGLYDDPANQEQGPVYIDFPKQHHVLVYGAPGTGKTTFVQTMIYGLAKRYTPEDVNMYILDFGSKSLGYCRILPHVGDVIFSNDEDKLKKLFGRIKSEVENRKKAFEKYNVGNIEAYSQAGGERLPSIIFIIDNFASFYELYGAEYSSRIEEIARDGSNYGIYLVITAVAVNTVRQKIKDCIGTYFVFRMNDAFDYQTLLGRREDGKIEPESVRGRGLTKVGDIVEYQTAAAVYAENEADRSFKLKEIFTRMDEKWKGARPESLPVIPDDMRLERLAGREEFKTALKAGLIPIGYDMEEIELVSYSPEKRHIFLVSGEGGSGKTNVLACICRLSGGRDIMLCDDGQGEIKERCSGLNFKEYCRGGQDLSKFVGSLLEEALKRHNAFKEYDGELSKREFIKRNYRETMVIIDDFDLFFSTISDGDLKNFGEILSVAGELGIYFAVSVSSGSHNKFKSVKEVKKLFDSGSGVVLGGTSGLGGFGISLSYSFKQNETEEGQGYFINKNRYVTVKLPYIAQGN